MSAKKSRNVLQRVAQKFKAKIDLKKLIVRDKYRGGKVVGERTFGVSKIMCLEHILFSRVAKSNRIVLCSMRLISFQLRQGIQIGVLLQLQCMVNCSQRLLFLLQNMPHTQESSSE